MSEQMYLLKFGGNWADEIDVSGFRVMSESEMDRYFHIAKDATNYDDYEMFCIGTNEYISWCDYDDFLSSFLIRAITEDEEWMLQKLFGVHNKTEFGFFPDEGVFRLDGERSDYVRDWE